LSSKQLCHKNLGKKQGWRSTTPPPSTPQREAVEGGYTPSPPTSQRVWWEWRTPPLHTSTGLLSSPPHLLGVGGCGATLAHPHKGVRGWSHPHRPLRTDIGGDVVAPPTQKCAGVERRRCRGVWGVELSTLLFCGVDLQLIATRWGWSHPLTPPRWGGFPPLINFFKKKKKNLT
jgi:hypothetical protein